MCKNEDSEVVENGLTEEDLKNQDHTLRQWTAEVKKAEKTPSAISEVASAVVDIVLSSL